jgi:RNA polymerase sigma-70 factor (ECF subfamily)
MAEGGIEFREMMRRVQAADPEAIRRLIREYGPHILRVVRRRLHQRMRSQFDSHDFVQDVWAGFFAAPPATTFDQPEALIRYLVRMARNKVVDAFRQRMETQTTNPNRARSLDGSAAGHATGLRADAPTPSRVAMAREQWEQLLRDQPVHYQRVLLLLSQGLTQQQVADELGIHERTVRRVVEKVAPGMLS